MQNTKQNQTNKPQSENLNEQQRQSQRQDQGVRTGKDDINEEKRNQNNLNQPR